MITFSMTVDKIGNRLCHRRLRNFYDRGSIELSMIPIDFGCLPNRYGVRSALPGRGL